MLIFLKNILSLPNPLKSLTLHVKEFGIWKSHSCHAKVHQQYSVIVQSTKQIFEGRLSHEVLRIWNAIQLFKYLLLCTNRDGHRRFLGEKWSGKLSSYSNVSKGTLLSVSSTCPRHILKHAKEAVPSNMYMYATWLQRQEKPTHHRPHYSMLYLVLQLEWTIENLVSKCTSILDNAPNYVVRNWIC